MKIFKVILSNSKETIRVYGIEELKGILEAIGKGEIVVCRGGVFNPAYFVGIVKDDISTGAAYGKDWIEREKDASPFAKLLSSKMVMLSDGERTKAQEKVAKEERSIK